MSHSDSFEVPNVAAAEARLKWVTETLKEAEHELVLRTDQLDLVNKAIADIPQPRMAAKSSAGFEGQRWKGSAGKSETGFGVLKEEPNSDFVTHRSKPGHQLFQDDLSDGSADATLLIQWLYKQKMSEATVNMLIQAECTSLQVLSLFTEGDFSSIGLSVGQKRLLLAAVKQYKGDLGSVRSPTDKQGPAGATQEQEGVCQDFFLGMGVRGSQKAYLDICDFVSIRSPYEGISNSETCISHKEDGTFVVKPSVSKRVTLDKVTMAQWIEANTLIMSQLVEQGVDFRAYCSYSVMLAQLAQKYDWISVLLWDREYRKLQANVGFRWGYDISHLRDVFLVPKGSRFQNQSKFQGSKAENNNSEASGQKGGKFNRQTGRNFGGKGGARGASQNERRDFGAEGKFKICHLFNQGRCQREKCSFKHFCAQCGSSDHGEKDHPKA